MINFFQQYGPVLGVLLTLALIGTVATVWLTIILIRWDVYNTRKEKRIESVCRFCDRFSVYWQDVEEDCPAWADCEKWKESIR